MTVPGRTDRLDLTPTMVAKALLELASDLARATDDLEELEAQAVTTQEDYEMAYNKCMLKARMDDSLTAAPDRTAWAKNETHDERLAAELAKAKVKARKAIIDVLKTRVTIGQTVVKAITTEIDLDGVRRR